MVFLSVQARKEKPSRKSFESNARSPSDSIPSSIKQEGGNKRKVKLEIRIDECSGFFTMVW